MKGFPSGVTKSAVTHVKKKLLALGRLLASKFGIDVGLLSRSSREAMIPEESVTTRKE